MNERDNGGNAFPESVAVSASGDLAYGQPGMTLRDWFATIIDKDEYGDIISRNLPRETAEVLAGDYPAEPFSKNPHGPAAKEDRIKWRLACLAWEFRVRAELRYMMADAMLEARE